MSVPVMMNLTEYHQCTSKLATYYPISKLKQGEGKSTYNGSVDAETGSNAFTS